MSEKEGFFLDEIISRSLELCREINSDKIGQFEAAIADIHERLYRGRLRLAVLGQFNRGKSTFINSLLKLPVLPTSILPITSVPTVIKYGNKNTCIIKFSSGRQELFQEGSVESIKDVLLQYVAEKNNPRNRLNVSEAVVICNSPLLLHGTVLIDTPGFGSTHLHNTETTINLLSSCDCAIFILSADLPITQVEIEFLGSVVKKVPYLFFIYNKIDLLTEEERAESIAYIKNEIAEKIEMQRKIEIIPVCAKKAEPGENGKKVSSEILRESGIQSVKTRVLGFMEREKYFALSDAVDKKLKYSLNGIVSFLKKEIEDLNRPVAEKNKQISEFSSRLENIKLLFKNINKKVYDSGEYFALEIEKYIKIDCENIKETAKNDLVNLCTVSKVSKAEINIIESSINNLIRERIDRLYMDVSERIESGLEKITSLSKGKVTSAVLQIEETSGMDMSIYKKEIDKVKLEMNIDKEEWGSRKQQLVEFSYKPGSSGLIGRLNKKKDRFVYESNVDIDRCMDQFVLELSNRFFSFVHNQAGNLNKKLDRVNQNVIKALLKFIEGLQAEVRDIELCNRQPMNKNRNILESFSEIEKDISF